MGVFSSRLQVVAAFDQSLVLLRDGTLVMYGFEDYGETRLPRALVPETLAASGVSISDMAGGEKFSVVLLSNGSVVCWGLLPLNPPAMPPGLGAGVTDVAVGFTHAAVVREDGSVAAWGEDACGETRVPAEAAATGAAIAVAAGHCHTLVLLAADGGRVVSFGELDDTTVPDAARANVTAIAAGRGFSAALLSNNSVLVWGQDAVMNDCKLAAVPPAATDTRIAALSAGWNHSLALLADGSVVSWGCNQLQKATVPASLRGPAAAIAAGYDHSLVLLRDGKLQGFGSNQDIQLSPTLLGYEGVVAVATGPYQSVAVPAAGDPQMFGKVPELLAATGMRLPAGKMHNVEMDGLLASPFEESR